MQMVAIRTSPTIICTALGHYSPRSHPPPLDKVKNQPHANPLISLRPIELGLQLLMLKSLPRANFFLFPSFCLAVSATFPCKTVLFLLCLS
jgi:hypothetical protein